MKNVSTSPSDSIARQFAERKKQLLTAYGSEVVALLMTWLSLGNIPPSVHKARLAVRAVPREQLSKASRRRLNQSLAEILVIAAGMRRLRDQGRRERALARSRWQAPPPAEPIKGHGGTVASRRDGLLAKELERALFKEARIRHGAAGGHSFTIQVTDDPARVDYVVEMRKNWDTYRGRFKGWMAKEDHHKAIVPRQWLSRVCWRGLAVVDGMMTLDAAPLEGAPKGVELYAARWVVQGRGYQACSVSGYIARSSRAAFHGESPKAALRGLKRKEANAAWVAALKDFGSLAELVARYAHLTVRIADARAIGACEYGILSWCAAVGIDVTRGEETIGRVFEAYQEEPRPEARAAILRAIRMRGRNTKSQAVPQTKLREVSPPVGAANEPMHGDVA